MKITKSSLLFAPLLTISLNGMDFQATFGLHDFMVNNIKTDGYPAHIKDGTSHTFGVDAGIWIRHTTPSDINFLAKAEVFLDRDKDELDEDHIPVWFDFLVDVDGPMYKINERNRLLWYVLIDNKQNTVSCIEREIRQHIGVGWEFHTQKFKVALNTYLGFYYIEIDDDTPKQRGYTRMELDDGEASNAFELETSYSFTQDWSIYAKAKRYSANAGFEELETNYELLLSYSGENFLVEHSTLNLNIKNVQYNFDRFNVHSDLTALPWDNDTLIKVYLSMPIDF